MPDKHDFWSRLCLASLTAVVVAVPTMGSAIMGRGYEVSKLAVALPLAFLALASAFLAAAAPRMARANMAPRIACASLIAFVCLAAVSTALSEIPAAAIFGTYFRREGLIVWAAYCGFFFAVLMWAVDAGRIAMLVKAIVLASVVPATYAIQQRLGWDFYTLPTSEGDATRRGGTLGNPVYLAAYLAILTPIAGMVWWNVRRHKIESAIWAFTLALAWTGLVLSQSRGPLAAAIVGTAMVACVIAARERARGVFLAAIATMLGLFVFVATINVSAKGATWAGKVPVLDRMILSLEPDAKPATTRATRSAATRLDMWLAGTRAFAAASVPRKLLGYGPDSAHTHYYVHLPPSVIQLEGHIAVPTFDRLNADTLDVGMNFGFLGWMVYCIFFGTVVFAAVRALYGLSGKRIAWIFVLTTIGGGVLASLAAISVGLDSAKVPAFGLGVGVGWYVYLLGCAWRSMSADRHVRSMITDRAFTLLAGLVAGLLVFWFDAQVNIPVPTTRLVSFACAALILAIGVALAAPREAQKAAVDSDSNYLMWVFGFMLVSACASLIPIVMPGGMLSHREQGPWWSHAIPMVPSLLMACAFAWCGRSAGSPVPNRHAGRAAGIFLAWPALYATLHLLCLHWSGTSIDEIDATRLSWAVFGSALYVVGMCVALAWGARWRSQGAPGRSRAPNLRLMAVLPLVVLSVGCLALGWRTVKSEVAMTVASWGGTARPELGERMLQDAIRAMPYERQYRRELVFHSLRRALADITPAGVTSGQYEKIARALDLAEETGRQANALFPRDPWIMIALANAYQVRALRLLRSFDPSAGEDAASNADELFGQSYELFPSQPILLRNWAQLKFDGGNRGAAYALLDRMEALLPNELGPYFERVVMALRLGDDATLRDTLARASKNLDAADFNSLMNVVKAQQK